MDGWLYNCIALLYPLNGMKYASSVIVSVTLDPGKRTLAHGWGRPTEIGIGRKKSRSKWIRFVVRYSAASYHRRSPSIMEIIYNRTMAPTSVVETRYDITILRIIGRRRIIALAAGRRSGRALLYRPGTERITANRYQTERRCSHGICFIGINILKPSL